MMGSLYRYPRLIILLLLLIMVAGSAAITTMPRLEDPHMENRVAFVITRFPGASAARVEALVTEKIERKLREVAEVDDISSSSRVGLSFITIEMKDEVEDVDRVSALLRDKLAELTDLPEGAADPVYDDDRLYSFTAIIGLVWHGESAPNYAILGRHARELDTRLSNIPGTDFVRTFGLPSEEIAVTIDDDMLAAMGMSALDVANRVFAADSKNSAGTLSGEDNRYVISVDGAFDSLERIRTIPISTNADTGIATLGDVAKIERTHRDPPDSLAYLSGDYGVVVAARMLEDNRIDGWMEKVQSMLDSYQATLPENITADIIFDQAQYTHQRLSDLMQNLIYSAFIVIIVLLVTLGWKASFIAGSILPLAALASLAVLNLLGFQIEQMVVTGMIVALGIMVDNAIVVTDEVQGRLLRGERRSQAVARTIRKLWLPLMGSTVTTVIAFMPIILMPGNAGEFVGGISASVIAALITSYIISFTIIAAMAGRVLTRSDPVQDATQGQHHSRTWWRDGVDAKPIRLAFRRSLHWSMNHPRASLLIASALPLMGLLLASTLDEQFFPPADRDQFHIEMTLPAQASIEETRQLVEEVHARLAEDPDLLSAHWYIGQSAAKFYYNLLTNRDGAANYAQAMITATSPAAADRMIGRYQDRLDRAYPHVQTLVRKLEQGPPYNAPVEIRIHGPDIETLRELGEQVRRVMASVPSIIHSSTSLEVGRPEITIVPNERAAATLGIDLRMIADQIRAAVDGASGGSIIEETEDVPVRIRTSNEGRTSLEGLRALELVPGISNREADGSFSSVPLTALARLEVKPSVGSIPRRNGERINTVQGFIPPDILPETAFAEVNKRLDAANFSVPPGYSIDYGGESEERNEAVGKLMAQAGVLGVLMVIAIVLTFNSFRLAAITFASAIQAAGLGLLSLWVFGYPLGFVVIVGLMGLIGLAINASIVILSELKNDPAAMDGDDEAIIHAVMSTGRHIISTTLTTVGGFMPLILSPSSFWPPFAVAIAGGALFTMIVSFYFAPAAFKLMLGRKSQSRQDELASASPDLLSRAGE
ncbi:efflux RND transporter permease subunit [Iodidimonas nitroreducens]|nr:efflux RND transporter permease subunit [Iodidimonas nitroreducens]